ncbi:MAG: zinc ribbon domain-containing protein [Nostocaceae cyanobacterium]|nr:zinc ribbon domain-containing protein [Nostocaceae cyanobacterium]
MNTFKTPLPQESLADYIARIRKVFRMTQLELASASGIHSRSIGKIERGLTTKLNRKTLHGLALALEIPTEFLSAVSKGEEVKPVQSVKFCPQCWTPGSAADPLWGNLKAKHCYLCGTDLRASCVNCDELVVSLKYRFCPMCGFSYKGEVRIDKT